MAARARRRLASLSAHVGCSPAGGENGARRQHNPGGTPMKLSSKEWQNRVLNLHELVPLARQSSRPARGRTSAAAPTPR